MKYCRFQTENGPRYGRVGARSGDFQGSGQFWIEELLPAPEEDLEARLIEAQLVKARLVGARGGLDGVRSKTALEKAAVFEPVRLAEASLLAPVTPSKIVCIGRNYRDHAAELGNEVPREPLLFLKAPSSLLAPGGVIRLPAASKRVDFEGELAVVIGRRCSHIGDQEDVRPYIRGYTIVNDVTARDLQKTDGQWSRAKGFDTFCPVGPVVTDEIDLEGGVTVETRLNGELRQQGSTRDLIFSIAALLRYITAAMALMPGDLIPTGTPAGVGPMAAGDVVEVLIEGIGALRNSVAS